MGVGRSKSRTFLRIKWSLYLFHVLGDWYFCWRIHLWNVSVGFGIFRFVSCSFLLFIGYKPIASISSQIIIFFPEDMSSSGNEGLDPSSEGWVASCFNDSQMHVSPEDMYVLSFCIRTFYLFWKVKRKNTSFWQNIFWKQRGLWYSAWYFRLVRHLCLIWVAYFPYWFVPRGAHSPLFRSLLSVSLCRDLQCRAWIWT